MESVIDFIGDASGEGHLTLQHIDCRGYFLFCSEERGINPIAGKEVFVQGTDAEECIIVSLAKVRVSA